MEKSSETAADRSQLEDFVLAICFLTSLGAGAAIFFGGASVLVAGAIVAIVWATSSFTLGLAAHLAGRQPAKLSFASQLASGARIVFAASVIVPLSRAFL
jgi:hypothetical protein